MSNRHTHNQILLFNKLLLIIKETRAFGEITHCRTGAGYIQDEPKCLVVLESEGSSLKKKKAHNDGNRSEGHKSPLRELSMANLEQFEEKNKPVLDLNPKNKINIHEATLM